MSNIFLSNLALCATKGRLPIHSLNCFVTVSSSGASLTSSSVIFVTLVISGSILHPGLINESNLSKISPFLTLTPPISIIELPKPGLKPVVSVSNTTYVLSCINSSLGLKQTLRNDSHISSSTPYKALNGLKLAFSSLSSLINSSNLAIPSLLVLSLVFNSSNAVSFSAIFSSNSFFLPLLYLVTASNTTGNAWHPS